MPPDPSSNNTPQGVIIDVLLPHLLPAQSQLYRADIEALLADWATGLDFGELASVTLALDFRQRLVDLDLGIWTELGANTAAVAWTRKGGTGKSCTHVVVDLKSVAGVFDPTSWDHERCLQTLAHAVGYAHSHKVFEEKGSHGSLAGLREHWSGLVRDCWLEFLTSYLVHPVGLDPLLEKDVYLSKAANELARESLRKANLWIEAEEKSFPMESWELLEAYRRFFLAASCLLGSLAAKKKAVSGDLDISPNVLPWLQQLSAHFLAVQKDWSSNVEGAKADFSELGLHLIYMLRTREEQRCPGIMEIACGPGSVWSPSNETFAITTLTHVG